MDVPGTEVDYRDPSGHVYVGALPSPNRSPAQGSPRWPVDTERLVRSTVPKPHFSFLHGITLWDGPCFTSGRKDGLEQLL